MAHLDVTINSIRKGDIEAFERLSQSYYLDLCAFGHRFDQDGSQAEDLLPGVFQYNFSKKIYGLSPSLYF